LLERLGVLESDLLEVQMRLILRDYILVAYLLIVIGFLSEEELRLLSLAEAAFV
jgi:hypothetical protein